MQRSHHNHHHDDPPPHSAPIVVGRQSGVQHLYWAPMRIGVVGAGAIGGLYGGVLARAGHQVSFLARGEQLRAIQSRGLKIESPTFGSFVVQAPATDSPAEMGEADLVLFAVKTYDLDQAVLAARQM